MSAELCLLCGVSMAGTAVVEIGVHQECWNVVPDDAILRPASSDTAPLDEPETGLARVLHVDPDKLARALRLVDGDVVCVRREGLVALLRAVDSGGFWSGELGIEYLAGSDVPTEIER